MRHRSGMMRATFYLAALLIVFIVAIVIASATPAEAQSDVQARNALNDIARAQRDSAESVRRLG